MKLSDIKNNVEKTVKNNSTNKNKVVIPYLTEEGAVKYLQEKIGEEISLIAPYLLKAGIEKIEGTLAKGIQFDLFLKDGKITIKNKEILEKTPENTTLTLTLKNILNMNMITFIGESKLARHLSEKDYKEKIEKIFFEKIFNSLILNFNDLLIQKEEFIKYIDKSVKDFFTSEHNEKDINKYLEDRVVRNFSHEIYTIKEKIIEKILTRFTNNDLNFLIDPISYFDRPSLNHSLFVFNTRLRREIQKLDKYKDIINDLPSKIKLDKGLNVDIVEFSDGKRIILSPESKMLEGINEKIAELHGGENGKSSEMLFREFKDAVFSHFKDLVSKVIEKFDNPNTPVHLNSYFYEELSADVSEFLNNISEHDEDIKNKEDLVTFSNLANLSRIHEAFDHVYGNNMVEIAIMKLSGITEINEKTIQSFKNSMKNEAKAKSEPVTMKM